jgi:hypothetical protein
MRSTLSRFGLALRLQVAAHTGQTRWVASLVMDEDILRLLTELDEAIERSQADGHIDDEERAQLRTLVTRVERALAEPEGENEGVVERLEASALRFEGEHPTLAALLRSAVNTLSAAGI